MTAVIHRIPDHAHTAHVLAVRMAMMEHDPLAIHKIKRRLHFRALVRRLSAAASPAREDQPTSAFEARAGEGARS